MKVAFYRYDDDGMAAAAIVRHFYPDTTCIPSNYNASIPFDKLEGADTVFILDFDFGCEGMRQLTDGRFHIIHIAHLNPIPNAWVTDASKLQSIFGPDRATCELTWEYCAPNRPIPQTFLDVADYCRWRRTRENHEVVHNGLSTFNARPGRDNDVFWNGIISETPEIVNDLLERGRSITGYLREYGKTVSEDLAYSVEVDGKKLLIANVRGNSLLLDSVSSKGTYDFIVLYAWIGSAGVYRIGVYSARTDGPSAGEFARHFGGGGGDGAATINSSTFPFPRVTTSDKEPVQTEFWEPLEMIKRQSFMVKQYVESNDRISFLSLWFETAFEGMKVVALNSPTPIRDIFLNMKNTNVEFGITFCYTNTGKYRVVIHPIRYQFKTAEPDYFVQLLREKYNAVQHADGSYWFYCTSLPFNLNRR